MKKVASPYQFYLAIRGGPYMTPSLTHSRWPSIHLKIIVVAQSSGEQILDKRQFYDWSGGD